MTIWNRIKHLFSHSEQPMNESSDKAARPAETAVLSQEQLVSLMHRLEMTMENAYSCEEVFALLDEYVEMVADNEEARQLVPLMQNHINICPDCREEFEMLLHILKTADETGS